MLFVCFDATIASLLFRNPPSVGIELFPNESLNWPGFVEFDEANGKILTASAPKM